VDTNLSCHRRRCLVGSPSTSPLASLSHQARTEGTYFSKIIKTPKLFFMFPPRGLQLRQRHRENNRATSGENRKGEATQPRPNPKLQPPIPESISARFVNSRPNPSSPSSSLPFGAPYRGSIRDLVRIFGYGDVGSWCV
jgi:hypothetical protein